MKLSRKAGIVMMASASFSLLLLIDDSPFVRKSSADIEKAKIGWGCVNDTVSNPCFAKRKAAVCPTGAEFYCAVEGDGDYTARSCIDISDNTSSCYETTPQEPCGIIKKCDDDSTVYEDEKPAKCNSTYKKCTPGSGISP